MISLEDCIELCGLTEDEVLAIARHEHIPEIVAAELGHYLAHTPEGEERIKSMILEDIAQATAVGDRARALALKLVARKFIVNHPFCEARHLAKIRYPDRRLAEEERA